MARTARRTPRPRGSSPAPRVREPADQLEVGEVAGRQRVGIAAAEEAEALDGPGADLGDRAPAALAALGGSSARRRPRGRPGAGRARGRGEVHRLSSAGARPAIVAGAGTSRSASRPSPSRGPQRPTMRRSIVAARLDSISCFTTAQASASHGHGRRFGRKPGIRRNSGPTSGSRRKRRKNGPWSSSTPSANRIRSVATSSCAWPAGRGARRPRRQLDRPRIDRVGAQRDPAPAGCQARTSTGLPSTWSRRVATPPRTADAVLAAARQPERRGRSQLDSRPISGRQPALSGRAGGRRPGRSGWRRRSGARGGGGEAAPRARPRADGADRAHRGNRRRPGQDPAGGGDRRGADLARRTGTAGSS